MRIAILQPTFLPWLGWFDIADQVDLLVLLDDVAFAKRSWQQRNRLRTARTLEFVTVPVFSSGRYGQPIFDVQIADPQFAIKLERTILTNYARAPFFEEFSPSFLAVLREGRAEGKLSALNSRLINWFFDVLALSTPVCLSSSLNIEGKRGEYMAALCEALGATEYLSPVGAEDYLLEDRVAFDCRGIKVWLHEYLHPEYRQVFQPFIPYASTLDLVFNEGQASMDIIRSGRCPARSLDASTALNAAKENAEHD